MEFLECELNSEQPTEECLLSSCNVIAVWYSDRHNCRLIPECLTRSAGDGLTRAFSVAGNLSTHRERHAQGATEVCDYYPDRIPRH